MDSSSSSSIDVSGNNGNNNCDNDVQIVPKDNGGNDNDNDDDDDDGTIMIVMEVTERRLTSIEINGNAAVVDLAAETRAAAGFDEAEELSAINGHRKLNN